MSARLRLEQTTQPIKRLTKRKSTRRRIVRYGLLTFNLLLLATVGSFVFRSSQTSAVVNSAIVSTNTTRGGSEVTDPLDQISSADIAVNVARITNMPEATAITNQADSVNAELAIVQASGSLVTKPQVVATAFKSKRDIRLYIAQSGDTATSIASKFNVTSDSVRWSNNLLSNTVVAGQKLYIPPVNGIVYIVASGDTPDSLAQKYHTTKAKIIAYNDAEIGGLRIGERIIIPDGQIQSTVTTSASYATGFSWGSAPIYGSNGYDYGYCTWYVASRISVPTNWGNANTWDNLAPMSGWTVSTVPRPGAIAQTDRGWFGHVAIVEAVSPDGSQIKYSDMNGIAGWGSVGYSGWTSVSRYEHYIYR